MARLGKGSSKGRKKIEMKRITNESQLLVTFSKRRSGLFKKASELSTLTGADLAVVVFSPSNKVYSFGHPSAESVINRYLGETNPPETSDPVLQITEALRGAKIQELNQQLTEAVSQMEAVKKYNEELDKRRIVGQEHNWWEAPVENLDVEQLEKLKTAMEELKNNVANEKLMMQQLGAVNYSFGQTSSSSYGGVQIGNDIGTSQRLSMMPHGYAPRYGGGDMGRPAANYGNAAGPFN